MNLSIYLSIYLSIHPSIHPSIQTRWPLPEIIYHYSAISLLPFTSLVLGYTGHIGTGRSDHHPSRAPDKAVPTLLETSWGWTASGIRQVQCFPPSILSGDEYVCRASISAYLRCNGAYLQASSIAVKLWYLSGLVYLVFPTCSLMPTSMNKTYQKIYVCLSPVTITFGRVSDWPLVQPSDLIRIWEEYWNTPISALQGAYLLLR